jgi:hypothetical protein
MMNTPNDCSSCAQTQNDVYCKNSVQATDLCEALKQLRASKYEKKNKKKEKLKNYKKFEPQVLDSLFDLFSSLSSKTSETCSSFSVFARAFENSSTKGFGLDDTTIRTLTELTKEVSRLSDVAEVASGGIPVSLSHNHTIGNESIDSFIKLVFDNKDSIGLALILLFALFLYNTKNYKINLALAIAGSIIVSHRSELKNVYDVLMSGFDHAEPFNNYEAQMIDNPIVKSLLLLFYLATFKGVDTEKLTTKFSSFFKHFSSAPYKAEATMGTFSVYSKMLQDLINQTCNWIGVESFVNFGIDKYPLSTSLLKEVSDFLKKSSTDKDLAVLQASRTCQVLQSRITDMLVKNKSDRDFSGDRVLLMQARSKLEEYDRELELRGAGRDITRVPPKAYLFIGKPKIGKSYLLKSLSYMALYRLCKDDKIALEHIRGNQLRDYIFTRNSCDKFWEGYYNQLLVILDEVGMQRDVAGADGETNEYSNLIKMVNDVVFPLLMASVEKKGTREFNSSLIFGTTNSYTMNMESITNPGAYDRRWTAFEVEVNPKYGSYHYGHGGADDWLVPDFDKMKRAGLTDKDIALSRFLIFKPRNSVIKTGYKGNDMNIDQLMDKIQHDIDSRYQEIEMRQKQNDILHSHFDPEALPGSFGPQSVETCLCKLCREDLSLCLKSEDLMIIRDSFKAELRADQISAIFENGYNIVLNEEHYLFNEKYKCFKDINIDHPNWDVNQKIFTYGTYVRTQYIKSVNFIKGEELRAKVVKAAKCVSFILGIGALVGGAIGLYKIFSEDNPEGVKDVKNSSAVIDDDTTFTSEAQVTDLNSQEVLGCILKRNTYAIGDDIISMRGFGLFMMDNIILIPKHYLIVWRAEYEKNNDLKVHMRRIGDRVNHQVIKIHVKFFLNGSEAFEPLPGEDLVSIYVGGNVLQKHASLRNYLVDDRYDQNEGEICFPVFDKRDLSHTVISANYTRSSPIHYKSRGERLVINKPIVYRYGTVVGDCGLPITVKDPFLRSQKLFGLHVSGSPSMGIGVSAPLTKGMFDRIADFHELRRTLIKAQYRIDPEVVLEMEEDNKGWNDLFAVPEDKIIPGKVNLGYIQPPRIPSKTNIIPSPLFKEIGVDVKTKPARLRPFVNSEGQEVNPNKIATEKYHHSVEYFDLDILDLCKDDVTNTCVNNSLLREDDRVGRRPLSFEEAVEGIPGVEGLDGIPRKTSAGYPRCMSVDQRGKRDFFGEEGDYQFDSAKAVEVKVNVEKIIGRAKLGYRGNHVFLDFPKDERRPKAKVDAGKTRKISACPVDLTIAIRMYFGAFIHHFQHNRIYNQSAVGVNVFDSQWDLIALYLGVDCRIIAGDFSNYDGKLPYCVMIRFLDTLTEFYGDRDSENELVRKVLFEELVNSRHIMDGVIYEWVGSNASGNPLTAVLNSWCNLVLLRYATLSITENMTIRSARGFLKNLSVNVRFMVYGDDNLISVVRNSPYAHLLTQDNYTKAFLDMGLEYTDEAKSGAQISQDRSIEDVSFLKRKWNKDWEGGDCRRTFLSPLDLGTILESIQWTKRQDFKLEYVKDNIINMLQELSQHPKLVFDQHAPIIVEACRRTMNFTPIPNNYHDCQKLVLARDGQFN